MNIPKIKIKYKNYQPISVVIVVNFKGNGKCWPKSDIG